MFICPESRSSPDGGPLSGVAEPRHHQSHLSRVESIRRDPPDDSSLVHDEEDICERPQLIEVFGKEKDSRTVLALFEEESADGPDGGDVQTSGRRAGDQYFRFL